MKRLILILAGGVVALVLWNKFSEPKPVGKDDSESTSSANDAAVAEKFSPRSRAANVPQNDSTTISANDEEEEWPKLSREQIEAYLLKTKRSAESLLNAFIETGDTNFLNEAVQNFPDHPLVQLTMLNRASPEKRADWLEKLKTSSPDNALPNYLSALDKLKSGNTEQALAEIDAARNKQASAFEHERIQSREEMYLLSGFSPLEAKEKSLETLTFQNLPEMKQLAVQISELQQKYKVSGDDHSNQQLAAAGVEVARKYSENKTGALLLHQLVGYAMENVALNNLNAGTYYDFLGKTAGERIQEIKNQRQEIKDLNQVLVKNLSRLNHSERIIYMDRARLYGELNAMRWLKDYTAEMR